MAMAFLEEEVDEGLYDEGVLAAMDLAVARRLGGIHKQNQQQNHQHPAPPLVYTAPQKKLAITHPSSPAAKDSKPPPPSPRPSAATVHHHHRYAAGIKNDDVVVAKAPQITFLNQNEQRDGRMPFGVGRDLKPQGFAKHVDGGAGNWSGPVAGGSDVKPNGYLNNGGGGGGLVCRGEGRVADVKQEEVPMSGGTAAAGRSGRRPLQEIQPWVGSNQIAERPSSTNSNAWAQAENASCSPKVNEVAWFSGFSGVAMFKECQEAAMRVRASTSASLVHHDFRPF